MKEVVLYHQFTQERVTLPVEQIRKHIVSFRWGMSGIYDLFLIDNKVVARSIGSRRKNPYCLWKAVDIIAVRQEVYTFLDKERKEENARYAAHQASMPSVTKKCT